MSESFDLQIVALGGGSGTRFWPISRRSRPKHLLALDGGSTLLAATFARVSTLVPSRGWWMVVGEAHAAACHQAVPDVPAAQVLVEPQARNTAVAIGLAAAHIERTVPNSVMAVLPADHMVSGVDAFRAAVRVAASTAAAGPIVTLGVTPRYPETGYGYIEQGEPDPEHPGALQVRRFVEKPSRERAQALLAQGGFSWNAGIYVMRPQSYLAEMERQLPELWARLRRVQSAIGSPAYADVLAQEYQDSQSISIDYGIAEGARDLRVVSADCGWSDVGSWNALGALVRPDNAGNVVRGRVVVLDSKDCVAYGDDGHLIGVVGLEGVVVVHTADATLVLPAARAQQVRDVVARIEAEGWHEYL